MACDLIPLRGRVAIRQTPDTRSDLIVLIDQQPDNDAQYQKSRGMLAQSSHRGRVLAIGLPAFRYGHEVAHGFGVGDEVVFVFGSGGVEAMRQGLWTDGLPCVWVTQEEVIAVVEPS